MYHSVGDSSNHFWPVFPRRINGEVLEKPHSSAGSSGNDSVAEGAAGSGSDDDPESDEQQRRIGDRVPKCGECGEVSHVYDGSTGDTICTGCGLARFDLHAQWEDPVNEWDVMFAPGRRRHQKSVHCVHKYFKKKLIDLNLKVTSKELYSLINSFKAVRSVWQRVASAHGCTYSLNYAFAARKLCEINCLWRLAETIALPKVRATTQKLDRIWLSVTEELGWDYYPSLADGHPPILRCGSE